MKYNKCENYKKLKKYNNHNKPLNPDASRRSQLDDAAETAAVAPDKPAECHVRAKPQHGQHDEPEQHEQQHGRLRVNDTTEHHAAELQQHDAQQLERSGAIYEFMLRFFALLVTIFSHFCLFCYTFV